jgi:hypothetical protein
LKGSGVQGSKVQGFRVQRFRGYNLLRIFQPGTVNGEPLNLGLDNIYEQAEKVSKLNSGLITYLLKSQKEPKYGALKKHKKHNKLNEPNEPNKHKHPPH